MSDKNMTDTIDYAKYKEYFIGYFDILGYRDMIDWNNQNAVKGFFDKLKETEEDINRLVSNFHNSAYKNSPLQPVIEWRMFSDNFIFFSENDYLQLANLLAWLQFQLSCDGIFIRGSLCAGFIYSDKTLLFGHGIIDAYDIENKIALVPRIVIDNSYIDRIPKSDLILKLVNESKENIKKGNLLEAEINFIKNLLNADTKEIKIKQDEHLINDFLSRYTLVDFDNSLFLDYLKINQRLFSEEIIPEHLKDIYIFLDYINKHKDIITHNIKSCSEHKDMRVNQKYQWCKKYHNHFCSHNRDHALCNCVIK